MKSKYYCKLAVSGMKKNARMYFPYMLTGTLMIIIFYILSFLKKSEVLNGIKGEESIRIVLQLGVWVIGIFSAIFLLYTNSFLMRRRKKEFGLFNILGMGKKQISAVLFWENLITYIVSLVSGCLLGVLLSKLSEIVFLKLLVEKADYQLHISVLAIKDAAFIYGLIYVFLFLKNAIQIRFLSASELVKSENVGEKAPKGNWFLGLLGLVILGGAYTIAIVIEAPLKALIMFFVAVVMVIVATYLLMIFGSVVLCRILQKKKGYYYKEKHFVSVSMMRYRMKRNGAGLASICILATMVLVMMAGTTSLYTGIDDAVDRLYPGEMNFSIKFHALSEDEIQEIEDKYTEKVRKVASEAGADITNEHFNSNATVTGRMFGDHLVTENSWHSYDMDENKCYFFVLSVKDYNAYFGRDLVLGEKECIISTKNLFKDSKELCFDDYYTLSIVDKFDRKDLDKLGLQDDDEMIETIVMVVPDLSVFANTINDHLYETAERRSVNHNWTYSFDTGLDSDGQIALDQKIKDLVYGEDDYDGDRGYWFYSDCKEAYKIDVLSIYATMFYLGILLSFIFMMATVLIIYYKQISEGYEDRERFVIMQKIGMSKKEIRKNINSQLLTIFFLPIIGAGLHLTFAFPMITRIFRVMQFTNTNLFAITCALTFLAFAACYCVIYKLTTNVYFKIVSEKR